MTDQTISHTACCRPPASEKDLELAGWLAHEQECERAAVALLNERKRKGCNDAGSPAGSGNRR
jgi:hypothetical protein